MPSRFSGVASVARRAGDPESIYADPTLARELLGWRPEHDLATIIESAYRWHVSQLAKA